MPISENISGNGVSAESLATAAVSDAIIDQVDVGAVVFEAKAPGGTWQTVSTQAGAYGVSTGSNLVSYRFRGVGLESATHVYFGP